MYNIGRIVSVQLLDGTYKIPVRFNLERFLGDAWHLIREPQQRHEVVIRFQPQVARNVAEVRWHRTQTCRWLDDGALEFRVTVDGLTEILWWILGYGDQAEVLAPPQLRSMLRDRVARMRQTYSSP
jgi:proteasome accessory factor B